MKILFLGLGSIGTRHAQIILNKYHHQLYAFRSGINNKPNDLGIPEINRWTEVKKLNPDIAFITNPTALHIKTAIKCANSGMNLFIDKPIGDKINGLEDLLKIIKQKNLVTYLGYNLRFNPVIENLKKYISKNEVLHINVITTSYLPNWRKGTDFKKSYRANKNLGGGVILDLSHEFDYLNYLLGNLKIKHSQFSKRSNLTNNVEDFVNVIFTSDKGPGILHINFFSHRNRREIQIDFKNLTVVADLVNSTIQEYKNEKLISEKQLAKERNISFEKQLEYFFKNINNPLMMNNLIDASKLYKKIIALKNEKH